jgi:hypothetical protein
MTHKVTGSAVILMTNYVVSNIEIPYLSPENLGAIQRHVDIFPGVAQPVDWVEILLQWWDS